MHPDTMADPRTPRDSMPTSIDETGDTGPVAAGGKPYFGIAAVCVPSHDEANAFRDRLRSLRRQLAVRDGYEFKFSETNRRPAHRRAFFSAALAHEFRFAVCLVDKTGGRFHDTDAADLHWACAVSVAVNLRPVYHQAEAVAGGPLREPVIVDDNEDADYLTVVEQAFRGLRPAADEHVPLVGKVRFRRSCSDGLLELADMICGAAGNLFEGDPEWYNMVRERSVGTERIR